MVRLLDEHGVYVYFRKKKRITPVTMTMESELILSILSYMAEGITIPFLRTTTNGHATKHDDIIPLYYHNNKTLNKRYYVLSAIPYGYNDGGEMRTKPERSRGLSLKNIQMIPSMEKQPGGRLPKRNPFSDGTGQKSKPFQESNNVNN